MLSEDSACHCLFYFSLPFQGEDGPPGNGTIGFPGAPVSLVCCFEIIRPLLMLV